MTDDGEGPSYSEVVLGIDRRDLEPLRRWIEAGRPVEGKLLDLIATAIGAGVIVGGRDPELSYSEKRERTACQIWAYVHVRQMLKTDKKEVLLRDAAGRFEVKVSPASAKADAQKFERLWQAKGDCYNHLLMHYYPAAIWDLVEEGGMDEAEAFGRLSRIFADKTDVDI